jgi:hypothetical protein
MEKNCLKCGKVFKVKPYKFEITKYCNKVCASKKVTRPCDVCSKSVTRVQSQMRSLVFCSKPCTKKGMAERMAKMNIELNPNRMTLETRTKVREGHLGKGEGKAYRKTFGVHTHRIVAAEKLGRPLLKGEVVHHKDENKLNNHPDNLQVFASQAEHARHHKLKEAKDAKRK